MLKFFVRTTGERKLDSSYSQIEYELLIDKDHKPKESFINQLDYISSWDSVLLEDDLILCKDFKNRIEKVIEEYKGKIINFFTHPQMYFETTEDFKFCYNQCTFYPKGIGKLIADKMRTYELKFGYDMEENKALKELNLTHVRYRPCLVQHIDKESIIQKFHTKYARTTYYFIDYLDELNIDYKDANSVENRPKLLKLWKDKINNF